MSYVMRCAIWYHLYNFKNVKNTHRGVLILVKLQAEALMKELNIDEKTKEKNTHIKMDSQNHEKNPK